MQCNCVVPRTRYNHASGHNLQRIQEAGVNKLNESSEIRPIAGITNIVSIDNVACGAGQCHTS